MWTLIGAGEKPLSACRKPMIDVIPSNVDYMHGKIAEIDPENNNILLKDGSQVSYYMCKSLYLPYNQFQYKCVYTILILILDFDMKKNKLLSLAHYFKQINSRFLI